MTWVTTKVYVTSKRGVEYDLSELINRKVTYDEVATDPTRNEENKKNL